MSAAHAGAANWAHVNGGMTSNGNVTVKSLSGGAYAATQNPSGAIAKANQNAATQPPTVIIQGSGGCYVGMKTADIPKWCDIRGGVRVSSSNITIVGKYLGPVDGTHLIADVSDQPNSYRMWGCQGTSTGAASYSDGSGNTALITSNTCPSYNQAASACISKGPGWFLPSRNQLLAIYAYRDIGGFNGVNDYYWSSTEDDGYAAISINMYNGSPMRQFKDSANTVRCVRTF